MVLSPTSTPILLFSGIVCKSFTKLHYGLLGIIGRAMQVVYLKPVTWHAGHKPGTLAAAGGRGATRDSFEKSQVAFAHLAGLPYSPDGFILRNKRTKIKLENI
jgi:hypothetical protein